MHRFLFYRLFKVATSAIAYFSAVLLVIIKMPKTKFIFDKLLERAARNITNGVGVNVTVEQNKPVFAEKNLIYVANHDCIIDGLALTGFLSLTTLINIKLKKFKLPFLIDCLKYYGHCIFTPEDPKSRVYALDFGLTKLKEKESIAIFPSEGISSKLYERFAKGCYYLAKQSNAIVIPLIMSYEPIECIKKKEHNRDLRFLIHGLFKGNIYLKCSYGKPIDIENIANFEIFKDKVIQNYNETYLSTIDTKSFEQSS